MIDGSFRENTGKTRLTETSRSETHACLFLSRRRDSTNTIEKRERELFIVLKKRETHKTNRRKVNRIVTTLREHTQTNTHKHTNTQTHVMSAFASAVSTHHHHRVMAATTKIPRGIRSSAAHKTLMPIPQIRRLFRLVSSAVRNTTNNFSSRHHHHPLWGYHPLSNLRLRQRERR